VSSNVRTEQSVGSDVPRDGHDVWREKAEAEMRELG
jgi:hypothetical protein